MSKLVVIYKSKYGSTKKYAEWIADELKGDLLEHSKIKAGDLINYDTIIYGGGLYAGGIGGISLITKNFEYLKEKNLIIFTVGLAPTGNKEIFTPIIEKNCTEEMRQQIQFFNLRGWINYKKLSLIHKLMMGMLKKTLAKKKSEELSNDDKQFLETYGKKVDFTDIQTIQPLVEYARLY